MSDGAPTTPAEIATARTLMAEARQEIGMQLGAGVNMIVLGSVVSSNRCRRCPENR